MLHFLYDYFHTAQAKLLNMVGVIVSTGWVAKAAVDSETIHAQASSGLPSLTTISATLSIILLLCNIVLILPRVCVALRIKYFRPARQMFNGPERRKTPRHKSWRAK